MGALQWQHWVLILVIVLLLFGSTRLPGLAKSVGQSMRIFRNEMSDLRDDKSESAVDVATDARTGRSAGSTRESTMSSAKGSPLDTGGDAPRA